MKTLIAIAGGLVAVIVIILLVVLVIGYLLPVAHVAALSIRLARPPNEVYATIRDFAHGTTWRSGLKSVEILDSPDGKLQFREHGLHGAVTFELVEDVPGERIVTRIADIDLGYSGTWTYSLAASPDGSILTITENGEVSNPVFRFMSRYVFGHTATIDAYLVDLAKHLGESASVENVAV
jgi:hypothetical protein